MRHGGNTMSNIFFLRQKDYDVATILIDDEGEIQGCRIKNSARVPFSTSDNIRDIYKWWSDRAIPEGRDRLSLILNEYGCKNTKELLLKNLGLSLTDTYWICPEEYSYLTYDDVNLFDNGGEHIKFHESDGRVHYTGTPNATVGGSLYKEAVKHDDGWYLEKGYNTKYPDSQQNINEVFISKLHEMQGWNEYVKYSTKLNDSNICERSSCKYFTSKSKELISAVDLIGKLNKSESEKDELDRYINLCVKGGLDEEYVRKSLDYMISMDYVTTNSDRHWGNFGIIRNPDTLKLMSVAPIFDNGNSMFFDAPYMYNRTALVRLENTGICKKEVDRLNLIYDRRILKTDLLPSPAEVKDFYCEYGIREDRAEQIAASYSNKLDLFMEYQHGLQISFAREMDVYIHGTPFIKQKPNPQYFEEHRDELTKEIKRLLV